MAGWFVTVMIVQPVRNVTHMAVNISRGNLSMDKMETHSRDEISDLTESLNNLQGSLQQIIARFRSSSNRIMNFSSMIHDTAKDVADTANGLDKRVQIQSRDLRKCTEIIQEMAQMMESVVHITREGASLSKNAYRESLDGNRLMSQMQGKIDEISRMTREIHTSIGLIYEFANNTAILAINASVEAIKAGDSGKGFGVVASEIRKLAEQSTTYAIQIGNLVERAQYTVDDGVTITKAVDQSFQNIKDIVHSMSDSQQSIAQMIKNQSQHSHNIIVTTIHEIERGMVKTGTEARHLSQSAASQSEKINNLSKMTLQTLQTLKVFRIGSISVKDDNS
ncbi:MAG: methyl-accepting chemotaxis protein [SAR324 cluster bacterium]|nr:methyl-accepting chemotaxis protein [SAR324 cluster bacterium]